LLQNSSRLIGRESGRRRSADEGSESSHLLTRGRRFPAIEVLLIGAWVLNRSLLWREDCLAGGGIRPAPISWIVKRTAKQVAGETLSISARWAGATRSPVRNISQNAYSSAQSRVFPLDATRRIVMS